MTHDKTPRTLKTVETTCAVLNALKETDGATITELANTLNLSKGAVYNHLVTLRQEQFVIKEDGEYKLSYLFFNFGEFVRHRSILYNAGRGKVSELAEQSGESSNIMIEHCGRGIYLFKTQGEGAIADEFHANLLENLEYLHWSSTGKAILAHLPEKRVADIVDEHGLPKGTPHTITNRDELFANLEQVREQGYALNDQEQVRGVRAVGAPVTDGAGKVLGAISVSGPISRFTDDRFQDELPELVMQTANIIEVTIETREVNNVTV